MNYKKYKRIIKYAAFDFKNKLFFGNDVPLSFETKFISPSDVNFFIPRTFNGLNLQNYHSKVVGDEFWSKMIISPLNKPISINNFPNENDILIRLKYCWDHWVNGLSWEETGAIDYLLNRIEEKGGAIDGCVSKKDLIVRYKKLDVIFSEIKSTRYFKKSVELNQQNFREKGGIRVVVGPKGEYYFNGRGIHRFAISKILNVNFPAYIGVIHKNAI